MNVPLAKLANPNKEMKLWSYPSTYLFNIYVIGTFSLGTLKGINVPRTSKLAFMRNHWNVIPCLESWTQNQRKCSKLRYLINTLFRTCFWTYILKYFETLIVRLLEDGKSGQESASKEVLSAAGTLQPDCGPCKNFIFFFWVSIWMVIKCCFEILSEVQWKLQASLQLEERCQNGNVSKIWTWP